MPTTPPRTEDSDTTAAAVVPVLAESVMLGKRRVDQGGYRISKHVADRVEAVEVDLVHQDVTVERRPIDRPLASDESAVPRYEGNTYVIPVVREILVTEKRLVLVEEIRITTTEQHETELQHVTLREEEVAVVRLHPTTAGGTAGRESPGADGSPELT